MSVVVLDALIAEAKERARRRRMLLAIGAITLVVAAALGIRLGLRTSASPLGCAALPSGWKERSVPNFGTLPVPPTLVLTNFRFGRTSDFYGLDSFPHWPRAGVMIALGVSDPSGDPSYHLRRAFRVARGDFQTAFEDTPAPFAYVATRSHGGLRTAYVEVGAVTPATIAAANAALAGTRACSA